MVESGQLSLDLPEPERKPLPPPPPVPRLLWCSDDARLGGPCPYLGERARFRPDGGCCKDLTAR